MAIVLPKKDLLMSCGEVISCALLSHFLEIHGIPSEPLTGYQARILTTDVFSHSDILNIDSTVIKKYLSQGKVVVLAGFQGMTWDGKITTLGRGGSDTTAVELGGYLQAERVDIFTDVPGIRPFFSFPECPHIPCPVNKPDNIDSLLRYLINHTMTSHK